MKLFTLLHAHLGAQRPRFYGAMTATVLEGVFTASQALALGVALVHLARGATPQEMLPYTAVFVLAFLGRLVATRHAWLNGFAAANHAVEGIRNALMRQMVATPLGVVRRWSAANLSALVSEDGRWITESGTFTLNRMVAGLASAGVLIGLAISFAPAVGLVVLGMFALSLLLAPLGNRLVKRLLADRSERLIGLSLRVGEFAEGIAVFRTFRNTGPALAQFREATARLRDTMLAATPVLVPLQEVTAALFSLGVPVALALVAYGLLPVDMARAERLIPALFVALAAREALAHQVLSQALLLRLGMLAEERISRFLSERKLEGKAVVPEGVQALTLSGVSFRYAPDKPEALRDISLDIPPGAFTAIVGPSGAGKSTLAALLMRFFDVSDGQIRLGDADLRAMDPQSLMQRIAYVGQEVHLFRDTLRANLLLGKPDASAAELAKAITAAQLDETIAALPQGLETLLGEGGKTLSGGEKQRIAIARAILKDAPLLVLDEATSALDPLNERAIQSALTAARAGRATIAIAHRLRTIAHADQIIVLDAGRVVECGTHDDLLAAGGTYARLWQAQEEAVGWRLGA